MFDRFRFPHVKNPKICPPPGKKSIKNSDEYQESEHRGVLALEYDLQLHYALAHMRRADGALPPHQSGRLALHFLAGKGQPRCNLIVPCSLCLCKCLTAAAADTFCALVSQFMAGGFTS